MMGDISDDPRWKYRGANGIDRWRKLEADNRTVKMYDRKKTARELFQRDRNIYIRIIYYQQRKAFSGITARPAPLQTRRLPGTCQMSVSAKVLFRICFSHASVCQTDLQ